MIDRFRFLERFLGKYFIIPDAYPNGACNSLRVDTVMIQSYGDGIYQAGLCFEAIDEGYKFITELSGKENSPEAALDVAIRNVRLVVDRFWDEDPLGPDGKPKL